jgi:hypothetical protein
VTDARSQAESRPALRIVGGGEPNDEQIAALVAVMAMRASRIDEESAPTSRWRTGGARSSAWGRDSWLAAARRSALRPHR